MALSKTDILNKALTLVGAAPVTSITDGTNNARILSRVYEASLRYVLNECKWNFATKRANLTVSADTFDFYDTGETVVYIRPTDIIRIFGVSDPSAKWREEGDYIFSDTSSLGIRYVYYLDDPTKYTIDFINAFIDRLCADIAYAIVNSRTLAEKYETKYTKLSLPAAMASNSQVGTQQTMDDSAWELAKYQNGHPNA